MDERTGFTRARVREKLRQLRQLAISTERALRASVGRRHTIVALRR
jgi:hypothetical protein